MLRPPAATVLAASAALAGGLLVACSSTPDAEPAGPDVAGAAAPAADASGTAGRPEADEEADAATADADGAGDAAAAAPPRIRAWMERLTVRHHYDPATGFIVADEVVGLPSVLRRAPDARTLVDFGVENDMPVVVFATADRCAPCQQYKKDALNDPEVVILLESGEIFGTHVEVDREPELAREVLGSLSIPMTYLFRNGEVVGRLGGQRSAEELRTFLRDAIG